MKREEKDKGPIAKDLKGDSDESSVEKEDKVITREEKDRSPVAKD